MASFCSTVKTGRNFALYAWHEWHSVKATYRREIGMFLAFPAASHEELIHSICCYEKDSPVILKIISLIAGKNGR
jgi:hypothetical protein